MTRVATRPRMLRGRGSERDRRLIEALRSHISKQTTGLTARELAVLDDMTFTVKLSDDIAAALCRQVSPENPESMKMFLKDFARWVERQRKKLNQSPQMKH